MIRTRMLILMISRRPKELRCWIAEILRSQRRYDWIVFRFNKEGRSGMVERSDEPESGVLQVHKTVLIP